MHNRVFCIILLMLFSSASFAADDFGESVEFSQATAEHEDETIVERLISKCQLIQARARRDSRRGKGSRSKSERQLKEFYNTLVDLLDQGIIDKDEFNEVLEGCRRR